MTQQDDSHYTLPKQSRKRIEPLPRGDEPNAAADVIRQKIADLYDLQEPAAEEEIDVVDATPPMQRSKHQAYMHELSSSGRSLAEIQTAWHSYYQSLPDEQKHEIWQEFYQQHQSQRTGQSSEYDSPSSDETDDTPNDSDHVNTQPTFSPQQPSTTSAPENSSNTTQAQNSPQEPNDVNAIREGLLNKVAGNSKRARANIKSMVFGLSVGGALLLVMAFGFFNERFIAPFITPSTVLSSTPLIIDDDTPVGDEAKIIIPKINLEIPVIYNEESITENDVQQALEDGVLHYPITPEPGENGNSVFFGHSSNNILNSGSYKFAFVLLNQLEEGDTFMLEKDGIRYVYRVFDKEVVPPTDFSVLDPDPERDAIATLITCDPPGTSINRLAVYGEQISPSPTENQESEIDPREANTPAELPSDAPTLWDRVRGN